jgi:iron complex transport system substrate-binding protein
MRGFDMMKCVALAVGLIGTAAHADTPPRDMPSRVVSMNLCTDQLAMMVASEGQLLSVSHLAFEPRGSAMAEEAKAYAKNRGMAEEIYLMRPDLVIAGSFSTRATVDMLKRLDLPVVVFDPAYSLDEVADRITQMGAVLGREDRAAQIVADYHARLAALQDQTSRQPRAALYYANGYTSGDRTLAGQILTMAGFANVATEAGYPGGGVMPLEVLAMAAPEAVITPKRYPGASRSEEILDHPVVQALRATRTSGSFTDRDWVCGTPFVLRAIENVAALRRGMGAE